MHLYAWKFYYKTTRWLENSLMIQSNWKVFYTTSVIEFLTHSVVLELEILSDSDEKSNVGWYPNQFCGQNFWDRSSPSVKISHDIVHRDRRSHKNFQRSFRFFRWVVYFIGDLYRIMELQTPISHPLTTDLTTLGHIFESRDKTLSESGFCWKKFFGRFWISPYSNVL